MAAPSEREPKPKEQLSTAQPGTYAWLEQYNGFEAGMSSPEKPLLLIGKENICKAYGCSCMDFVVHKIVSGSIQTQSTQVQIEGHITDQDEIVDLMRITLEVSEGLVKSRQEEVIGINEAMQEVHNAMLVLKDAIQVSTFLPRNP